ncbi:tyrosinase family protein [Roseibium algicola]|uniref:tyrosinase family protein n=1 Tax=Roseibium algicola TaxID=2857014 RepID=UPI003458F807
MIRRSFTSLSMSELDALASAFNKVWDAGLIVSNAQLHDDNFYKGIHWGPAFLPWHRDFLRKLELALQSHDTTVTLPYWDWTEAESRDLNSGEWERVFGGRDNKGGKFDHWTYFRNNVAAGRPLPALSDIVGELEAPSFLRFRALETGSHVPGHTWTGGSMASGKSPLDPLFYLHHCNLDRIWSIWQLNNSQKEQYEHTGALSSDSVPEARVPLNVTMIGGATPASMLDHSTLGYTYSEDQRLADAWRAKHGTELVTHVEQLVL